VFAVWNDARYRRNNEVSAQNPSELVYFIVEEFDISAGVAIANAEWCNVLQKGVRASIIPALSQSYMCNRANGITDNIR